MKRLETTANIAVIVAAVIFLSLASGGAYTQSAPPPEPKTPIEWFQRAADQMNIRAVDAKPFHLKVSFQAYPGIELLGRNRKSEMAVGNGFYEETWLDLHTWRREVTLADYHAVEEDFGGVRKMQASSEYEPSRVLMLLDALLSPIPKNLTSREFAHDTAGWKFEISQDQRPQYVCSRKDIVNARAAVSMKLTNTFCFLPHGILVLRNERDLVTAWTNDILFGDKVVPRTITVMVGDRTLLSAAVTIEAADNVDAKNFVLPVMSADAGMTLRSLHPFEVRMPNVEESRSWVSIGASSPPVGYAIRAILDRTGRYRDVELMETLKQADPKTSMDSMRNERNRPATIDGKPREVVIDWTIY